MGAPPHDNGVSCFDVLLYKFDIEVPVADSGRRIRPSAGQRVSTQGVDSVLDAFAGGFDARVVLVQCRVVLGP
jgi:hypothetical protein